MKRRNGIQRGVVYVLAMVLLAVLTSVAVTVVGATGLSVRSSGNYATVNQARMTAESGQRYLLGQVQAITLPYSTNATNFLANLSTALGTRLNGTANLAGQTVGLSGSTIVIPTIQTPDGSFSGQITWLGNDVSRLEVTGWAGEVSRTVVMNMLLGPKSSGVFDYGIASRGKIVIKGNATFDGMTLHEEANVLSTKSTPVAIEAGGSAYIGGDLSVTGEEGDYVLISGRGLSIGGTSEINEIVTEHVHLGVDDPEWPVIDSAPLIPFATNVITSSNPPAGTYNNIRIPANTNATFGGDTVINGVVYVEAPNNVAFTSKTVINGIIVTEEDYNESITACSIDFRGQVTAPGPGALPETLEWAPIRAYAGSVMLAPSFELRFRGATNSINGTIAADELSFLGNSTISGTVNGSILGLKNLPLTLSGSCTIRVDKLNSTKFPPGFIHPRGLTALAETYAELAPTE